jgi:CheY-like chemotaxis protein
MKKILVIEDNVDLAENIVLLLKENGYDVQAAYNGKNGLSAIMEYDPEIIICDIMLPDISGYKLLSEIKKLEEKLMPIFIFLTAKTLREDLRRGMILGADDYITKPFTYEELISAINTQVKKRAKFLIKSDNKKEILENSKNDLPDLQPTPSGTALNYNDHIFISDKKNPGFYLVSSIIVIKSLKDYTQLFLADNKRFFLRKSMKYWEDKLPNEKFVRIHRQTLINVDYVEKVEPISSNRYRIILKYFNEELEASQRLSSKIKKLSS